MTELFKVGCSERGCDCHSARVVEEGGDVLLAIAAASENLKPAER